MLFRSLGHLLHGHGQRRRSPCFGHPVAADVIVWLASDSSRRVGCRHGKNSYTNITPRLTLQSSLYSSMPFTTSFYTLSENTLVHYSGAVSAFHMSFPPNVARSTGDTTSFMPSMDPSYGLRQTSCLTQMAVRSRTFTAVGLVTNLLNGTVRFSKR